MNVDSALIEAIRKVSPSTSARMRGSVKPAFGSIALGPGFVRCDGIDEGNAALRRAAIDIWAFDQLILNPDRNATKPNCLVRGDVLAVIDHEKALNSYGVGGLVPAPWQDNWTPDPRHLFSSVVSVGALELEPLERSWQTVTSENLDQILAAVPSSWDVAGVLREIREYLDSLLGNLKEAFGNLRKVAS